MGTCSNSPFFVPQKNMCWVGKYFPAYTAGQTANAPGPSSAVFNFKSGENKVVPDLSAGIDSHAYDDGSEGGKGTE